MTNVLRKQFAVLSLVIASLVPAYAADQSMPDFISVQKGSDVPLEEAMWAFFVTVSFAEESRPGMGVKILNEGVGLDVPQAESLFDHIRAALDQHRRGSIAETDLLCGSSVDPSTLASTLADSKARLDEARRESVSNLAPSLSHDSMAEHAVIEWVNTNLRDSETGVTVHSVDHSKHLAALGESGSQIYLDRICKDADTQPIHIAN